MTARTKILTDPAAVADAFAADFADWVQGQDQDRITVALSGGSTPKILFDLWASQFAETIDWSRIHFFWGDERCVPPESGESNYGVAKALFFDRISILIENVHRVWGEANPLDERVRYEKEIREHVESNDAAIPRFDLVILGMGDDGHTASIFPDQSQFLTSEQICEVATHPESGQKRITLTGPVINNAKRIAFLVTGQSKAEVLADVIHKSGRFDCYPASHIATDDLCFYVDRAAATKL